MSKGSRCANGHANRSTSHATLPSHHRVYGEAASASERTVEDGRRSLLAVTSGYDKRDIYNLDETAYFYCSTPSKTVCTKGIPGRKKVKKRITVAVTSNADGSSKWPLLFIGNARKPRCFGPTTVADMGVEYDSSKKGWMTGTLLAHWIEAFNTAMRQQNRHRFIDIAGIQVHEFHVAQTYLHHDHSIVAGATLNSNHTNKTDTKVMNIAAMLERFQVLNVSDQLFFDESLNDYGTLAEEANDFPAYDNPVIDKVLEDGGDQAFRTFTNFTPAEFDVIWTVVEPALHARWQEGRGRKSPTTARDAFFITLVILKYFQTWEKHAVDFGIKSPTLEKMVMRVIEVAQPVLYDHFVRMPSMRQMRETSSLFEHYPCAKYATDVKFQPSHRPTRRFGEQKHFFSGKHKLYGLKIEASVSPDGFLVDMSPHVPGSVSDITIFRSRMDVHEAALAKDEHDLTINDNGELFQTFGSQRAVLVDKVYIGLANDIRAINPKKRPVNGILDRHDLDRNNAISSDRVIVENFFGRVCLLWKVSNSTFV
ncbi:hypothetical protein H310_14160 [Aphanomyces invadans]|uniref:DDE Tnp4 domain-containing protein n=1 Tax=Aphanomyces invadans TaxID=157072 RepID=A0A024TAV8_9STRA|nr:hypothetical protein H310_14160 [Aphanomyces invadans]ETV91149.1 hypothetical protein H310_14160 [Aphanomyces invadans]|eukprot:XP_008880180.1 hypothetical protein H310_14160 [Aphanomyces invadans]